MRNVVLIEGIDCIRFYAVARPSTNKNRARPPNITRNPRDNYPLISRPGLVVLINSQSHHEPPSKTMLLLGR